MKVELKIEDDGAFALSMFGTTWDGEHVYVAFQMTREQALSVHDQLGKALHGSAAFLQVAEPTPIIRNPLALNEDALAASLSEPGLHAPALLADEAPAGAGPLDEHRC